MTTYSAKRKDDDPQISGVPEEHHRAPSEPLFSGPPGPRLLVDLEHVP
jgi:hypothetical protein